MHQKNFKRMISVTPKKMEIINRIDNTMGTKKNVTIIAWEKEEFGMKDITASGYTVEAAYCVGKKKFLMCIRELYFKLKLPFQALWYNKKLVNKKGTFIIFDAMMNINFLKWLAQKNPEAKLIFWYWNKIIEKKVQPEQLKELGYDVWTFNELDKHKYNLKLNDTYYCDSYYNNIDKFESEYDIVFVGKDKGRMKMIDRLMEENMNLKWYIHITADHFYERWKDRRYKGNISYKETLELQGKSKAILEIVPENSCGLTLRTMDAINQRKKLITNNPYVRKKNFYNENNILIINKETKASEIEQFMKKEYVEIDSGCIREYLIDSWVERFLNEEES